MSKRTGTFQLSCGHTINGKVDVAGRHLCPTCKRRDQIVVRVTASKRTKPKEGTDG